MTLVSDDPSWWSLINLYRVASYFGVAAAVVVTYDWALTFGQEVELIWATLVTYDRSVSRCALSRNVIYGFERTAQCSGYLADRYSECESIWSVYYPRLDCVHRIGLDKSCGDCNAGGHHHRSVTCHVPTIQKGPDISHCYLPGCQHLQWGGHCDNKPYLSPLVQLPTFFA
ncbi:hypothetical protein BDR03DRAFT_204134 [Suillus americanus]|nr:hypothetical protein BDR03DRAFT_204134 [Suillus americanus]